MNWIRYVVNDLVPDFAGTPTFCEDPDGLLQFPLVREALRTAGMTIVDWDGTKEQLCLLTTLGDDCKPLVLVPGNILRHAVESNIAEGRWESISIAEIFGKFPVALVKAIPVESWDRLYVLHEKVRQLQSPVDCAELMSRGLYGIDPLYVAVSGGWIRVLAEIALGDEGLPAVLVEAIEPRLGSADQDKWSLEAMKSPSAASSTLRLVLRDHPDLLDRVSAATRVLLESLSYPKSKTAVVRVGGQVYDDHLPLDATASQCLAFATRYFEHQSLGNISKQEQLSANREFSSWVRYGQNYALMVDSLNPDVLKVTMLVDTMNSSASADKALFLVIDGLSFPAWAIMEDALRRNSVIGSRTKCKAAFALLPTLTILSRRAIFERSTPNRFGEELHSDKLERRLWNATFAGTGNYFVSEEIAGINDAFSLGKHRICVVDRTWDKLCHKTNPSLESWQDKAHYWALNSKVRAILQHALAHDYRIFITSDHGQTEAEGLGDHKAVQLTEEYSKRVLIFGSEALRNSYVTEDTVAFQPHGLGTIAFPLFAKDGSSFGHSGETSICHGGISIEEMVIPFVEVS